LPAQRSLEQGSPCTPRPARAQTAPKRSTSHGPRGYSTYGKQASPSGHPESAAKGSHSSMVGRCSTGGQPGSMNGGGSGGTRPGGERGGSPGSSPASGAVAPGDGSSALRRVASEPASPPQASRVSPLTNARPARRIAIQHTVARS